MRRVAAARTPVGECDIDLCDRCHALWFDAFESVQLAPSAILALFREVARAPKASRTALASSMRCPRCRSTLVNTRDLRHTTRFAYWRCPKGHGRLTPFVQFLREKDFIRPLDPGELERLRVHIRSVRCSGCGASVDLARDMACRYCGAAVEALDPDALARTLATLEEVGSRPREADVRAMTDAMLTGHASPRGANAGRYGVGVAKDALPSFDTDLVTRGIELIGDLLNPGNS